MLASIMQPITDLKSVMQGVYMMTTRLGRHLQGGKLAGQRALLHLPPGGSCLALQLVADRQPPGAVDVGQLAAVAHAQS